MTDSTVIRGARKASARAYAAEFLAGGGDMGRRMRAVDWAHTPLGGLEHWPTSLKTVMRVLLTARQPMLLFWGERLVMLYNDAAKGVLSARHPHALGHPLSVAWHEVHVLLGERIEEARVANEGGYDDAVSLPIEGAQDGAARFAVSYSPIPGDDGKPGGLLCVLNETASMHEAVIGLASELDPDALLGKVTEAARRLTKARFGAFERTYQGKDPVRIDDVAKDSRYGRRTPPEGIPRGEAVRSYLAVPVTSRNGEVLGGLFFGHPEPGMFDERAERNARAIAAHAATALDNANRFALARGEIEQRSRAEIELAATRDELAVQVTSLTSLHEMATRLAAVEDIGTALQAILETAVAVCDASFGSINLYDPDAEALVIKAHVGFDEEALAKVRILRPGRDPGACAKSFETGRRMSVSDTETDPCFEGIRDFARHLGIRSVHSMPIVTRGGEAVGVLSVHFKEPRMPTTSQMQLVEVCARHAADAIETHRSREALRESEKLYRAIGESTNYGVWLCDERGRSVYVSESFLKLIGLTQGGYARSIWSLIEDPEEADRVRGQWKRMVAEGRDWDAQVTVKTAAGGTRAILSRGVAIRDANGRISGWAGMNLDVDRLKRVENELRELDQRKDEFLATLAHELRNPLAPIRNGLEIMRLGRGNAGMVEQARTMMERQLHQMIRLVDDLLDVSRVSRGKIELRREAIDLRAALSNAVETAKPAIDQNAQTLVIDVDENAIAVDGDLTRLSQVFANLLNNAAKYTERGGRIEVSARVVDGTAVVRVKDDGIGIPAAMLERVFDIFTQVDRSLEKARGGLGIGLSIARRLVEMHGGTIAAESAGVGKGSEFVVRLPGIARPASDAAPAELSRNETGHRRRVLVADDNLDSALSLSLVLQMMGNDVRVANDGFEAIAVAESFHPDAIFLDIGMPGLNGYEVCRKLRENGAAAGAVVVALTGWGQQEDRRRSQEFGFDHHLVKPVEPSILETLLRGLPPGP